MVVSGSGQWEILSVCLSVAFTAVPVRVQKGMDVGNDLSVNCCQALLYIFMTSNPRANNHRAFASYYFFQDQQELSVTLTAIAKRRRIEWIAGSTKLLPRFLFLSGHVYSKMNFDTCFFISKIQYVRRHLLMTLSMCETIGYS